MEIKIMDDLKTWLIQEPILMGYTDIGLYFISMRDRGFYGLMAEVSEEEREGELFKKTASGLYLYQTKLEFESLKKYDQLLFARIIRKFRYSEDEMNRPNSMIGDFLNYKEKINEEKLICEWHQKYKMRALFR